MNFNHEHTKFLQFTGRIAFVLYGLPAALMVLIFNLLSVPHLVTIQFLLVYLIASLAHLLSWGFQASGCQSAKNTEILIAALKNEKP